MDVIRSGLRHADSSVGIYAPDGQSYDVFRELFEPALASFRAPFSAPRADLACLNPPAVVSTRIRMARNLVGHAFPAGMSSSDRLRVQEKISHACHCLADDFKGTVTPLSDVSQETLDDMITAQMAFGPQDKYMAAAGIHNDWPIGRSVFNTQDKQLSLWINEEDHLRVAVVMPGACVSACYQLMTRVIVRLAAHLDFCKDARLGFLTSCPSNVGSAMRVSYRVDLRRNAAQESHLQQLKSGGIIQIRDIAGEHAPRTGELIDISFRHRVGISETHMLRDIAALF